MNTREPSAPDVAPAQASPAHPRRDALATRSLLVRAARLRFARDGYSATTVRDIATDAGVNVALINRYFASKAGLFEACMTRTIADLEPPETDAVTYEATLRRLVTQATRPPTDDDAVTLLLLLRSSGDDEADSVRRATLRTFAERLAATAGWRADDPTTAHLVVRAEIAIATLLGVTMLRTSTGVEPLASASEADLAEPLGEAFRALLGPGPG